jgi:hypothetical protein
MGAIFGDIIDGRLNLRGGIRKGVLETNLVEAEATHVLSAKTCTDAHKRHFGIGKPIEIDRTTPATTRVRCAFECGGIGLDVEGAKNAADAAGVRLEVVTVSEKEPRLLATLLRRFGAGANAPIAGMRAGFAYVATEGSWVHVMYSSPDCSPSHSDVNGAALGHPVGDTRSSGMLAVAATIASGLVPIVVVESVAGASKYENMLFLERVQKACGGVSFVVHRWAKDFDIPLSCHRELVVHLGATVAQHRKELEAALRQVPKRRRVPLTTWWKDRELSTEYELREGQQIVIYPAHRRTTGAEDAPTRIGEVTQRGDFYAAIYEGGQEDSVMQRPRHIANRPKGLGIYRYDDRFFVPSLPGGAKIMGTSLAACSGLSTAESLLALGNGVPIEFAESMLRPIFDLIKRCPELRARVDTSGQDVHMHIREVVHPHLHRTVQAEYTPLYPFGTHTVADAYRGPVLPRLEVGIIGGCGINLRGMVDTGLYIGVVLVPTPGDACRIARTLVGNDFPIWEESRVAEIKAAVVVGLATNMSAATTALYTAAMKADWLTFQLRLDLRSDIDAAEAYRWMRGLCDAKGSGCQLSTCELDTGGFGDTVLHRLYVGSFSVGVIADKRGKARTAAGLDVAGSLITHLVSPSVVIALSPRGTRMRGAEQICQSAVRRIPLVHGKGDDGRPVVDPSGPVQGPIQLLIGDGRLELRSSSRVFAREAMVGEALSLYGLVDKALVTAVGELEMSAVELAAALENESPPNFNRAQSLALHQYLVPETQISARIATMGDRRGTSGTGGVSAMKGEKCRIVPADMSALDVKVLKKALTFGAGAQMLRVPAGTSVEVVSELETDAGGTRGVGGGGVGDWCAQELF